MLPSKSPNKAFYRAFGLVIAGLVIGISVLALLVTTSGPRVRNVLVQNASGDEIASTNQGLTLVFDRPIESGDYDAAIDIQPEVEHTVSHRNQQLNITFDQNLLSNTKYAVTVKPMLEDNLGKWMGIEYSYEFTTAEPSFTYLERNYDPGAPDKVIEKEPLSQKSYVLFGSDRIKSFARNSKYMAVVLPRADNTDELRVVDLGSREQKPVDIPSDVRVDSLRFSPVDNRFVFVAQSVATSDISETGESYIKASGDKLYSYDIDGEQLQPVDTLSDEGNVQSASYSRDGQALLYRTLDGEYYLTGATQETEPVLLGKYQDGGGFDRTNTRLAFLYGSGVAVYDAQAKELLKVPNVRIGGRISTPAFLHNSDDLLYLRDPLDAQTLQLYTANTDGKVEEQTIESQPPARFFDEPQVSYDDRYVLIEATFEPQGSDDYIGNRKPKDARLVLYDRLNQKVIDTGTRGVDPVWSR